MIVCKTTAIDPSCRDATDIRWIHAIVDALREGLLRHRDRGFEISDPRIRFRTFQFFQRVAPNVVKSNRTRNWSVCGLGKIDVLASITNIRFVQNGINGVWKYLIDAASGHDIATEKQGNRVGLLAIRVQSISHDSRQQMPSPDMWLSGGRRREIL